MKALSWRVILSGLATFLVVSAGLVWLLKAHVLLAGSSALMVAVAVAVTVRCGELPQAPPQAIDWYWLGAFAVAWLVSTVGLAAIDGLGSQGRPAWEGHGSNRRDNGQPPELPPGHLVSPSERC